MNTLLFADAQVFSDLAPERDDAPLHYEQDLAYDTGFYQIRKAIDCGLWGSAELDLNQMITAVNQHETPASRFAKLEWTPAVRGAKTALLAERGVRPIHIEEYETWCAWLPRASRFPDDGTRAWTYRFDSVPFSVREVIAAAMRAEAFESFEIRFPAEPKAVDPVLFGKIGRVAYLIARWGAEQFLTLDQVRMGLEARQRHDRLDQWCNRTVNNGSVFLGGTVGSGLASAFISFGFLGDHPLLLPLGVLSGVAAAAVMLSVEKLFFRKKMAAIRAECPYAFAS
ncbi:hypothetical protein C4552_02320 [Candidatus Parcubacteria bacterium]|nr:MAG: hypothetical protein C4552_02320 [Candidatus Parcubacteria bacterium]